MFHLTRDYPVRPLITQWQETELAFIQRLLAELGIWFRFENDTERACERIIFADSQQDYQFERHLSYLAPAGLTSAKEAVWHERIRHRPVTGHISVKDYRDHHNTRIGCGDIDSDAITTGYHSLYGGPPMQPRHDDAPPLVVESADFYAKLQHERMLNQRTNIHLFSNVGWLSAVQVLTVTDGPVKILQEGMVITLVTFRASRASRLHVSLWGIPYCENISYRPRAYSRPQIYGTLPARIETRSPEDIYALLDNQGRYRVRLDFDRSESERGFAYLWLRLQVPWAGACSGWHLPLLAGTEVAVGYEEDDPDKPYIAYALHDSEHLDVVNRDNASRHILRTAAGNELRMEEDRRGSEHIALSTPHSASALNQGHLVDEAGGHRGSGFELRSDSQGVIRAGKGLLISTYANDESAVMDMAQAREVMEDLQKQLSKLEQAAMKAGAVEKEQKEKEKQTLEKEKEQLEKQSLEKAQPENQPPGKDQSGKQPSEKEPSTNPNPATSSQENQAAQGKIVFSAPNGILFTSGAQMQLATHDDVKFAVGGSIGLNAIKSLVALTAQGIEAYSDEGSMALTAAEEPIDIQAQNSPLSLSAQGQLALTALEDDILFAGKKRITLIAGGSYLRLDKDQVEYGTPLVYLRRAKALAKFGKHSEKVLIPYLAGKSANRLTLTLLDEDDVPINDVHYQVNFSDGSVLSGQLDPQAFAAHQAVSGQSATTTYTLPPSRKDSDWHEWQCINEKYDRFC